MHSLLYGATVIIKTENLYRKQNIISSRLLISDTIKAMERDAVNNYEINLGTMFEKKFPIIP